MSNSSNNENFNLAGGAGSCPGSGSVQMIVIPVVHLSGRLFLLFLIVWLAVRFIPQSCDIGAQITTLIAFIVVIVYAFIEVVFRKIKNFLCSLGGT